MSVSPVRQGPFHPVYHGVYQSVPALCILASDQAVFVDTSQLLSALVNSAPRHLGLSALCLPISGNLTGTEIVSHL